MKKIVFIICCFFVCISFIYAKRETVVFDSCVDGDTFKINDDGEIKKVRMLAIDTPETVKVGTEVQPFGKEASNYTCDKLTNAKKVELEYDSKSSKTDKYGRILAWVYADDIFLQKELVSLGYAKVTYVYGKYMYLDELYSIEEEASKNKVGLWQNEEYNKKTSVSSKTETKESSELKDKLKDDIFKYIKKKTKKLIDSIFNYVDKAISEILGEA